MGKSRLSILAASGALAAALVGCSGGIIPNYQYYQDLSVEEIAADFKYYSKDEEDIWLSAPWMVELVGWLNEHQIVDNQAQKLSADYDPQDRRLNLHAQVEYAYTVGAKKVFEPAVFDRVRVNDGALLQVNPAPVDVDCDENECTYSQKVVVPLTVAEVVGSRYTGLTIQLIDPGKPAMTFRMPETYVRAFSEQVGKKLGENYMDYDRVVDANARLDNTFGRDQLTVEDMAREWQCDRTTVQALELNGPQSLFQVECGDDSYRLVRCEWGECTAEGPEVQ
ncbi:hypothetical protein [Halioxenophilus aromaticivorans]|uniref:Lipoprotein n=1 Tax=Halioxenophilus aromaticivorans TaxID=1306992 RepID=A0AAV3U0H2_9ALTE